MVFIDFLSDYNCFHQGEIKLYSEISLCKQRISVLHGHFQWEKVKLIIDSKK